MSTSPKNPKDEAVVPATLPESINESDSENESPIFYANDWRNVAKIEELLKKNKSYVDATDARGCTVLHHARTAEIVRLLLDAKASVRTRDDEGDTPLNNILTFIGGTGDEDDALSIVSTLVRENAEINTCNNYGDTPLHNVVSNQGCPGLVELLLKNKANLHAKNKKGQTPLHLAVATQTYDFYKDTRPEIIQRLLTAQASLNVCNNRGQNAFAAAHATNVMLLHKFVATTQQTSPQTKLAVLDEKMAMTEDAVGNIALHYASSASEVTALLDKKSAINHRNHNWQTALNYLIHNHSTKVHNEILLSLIRKKADVNIADSFGHTPLYKAVFFGCKSLVSELIDAKADINVVDHLGQTALNLASKNISRYITDPSKSKIALHIFHKLLRAGAKDFIDRADLGKQSETRVAADTYQIAIKSLTKPDKKTTTQRKYITPATKTKRLQKKLASSLIMLAPVNKQKFTGLSPAQMERLSKPRDLSNLSSLAVTTTPHADEKQSIAASTAVDDVRTSQSLSTFFSTLSSLKRQREEPATLIPTEDHGRGKTPSIRGLGEF